MKQRLACAALMGLLTACSQQQSLRDTVAAGYYVGDASPEDAATCVSGRWSGKTTQLVFVPTAGGTSIELWDGANGPLLALVDIIATGATTTAKYYAKSGHGSWYSDQVMDCMHATSSIQ